MNGILRFAGKVVSRLAFVALLGVLFVGAAYLSFSLFVRGGVTTVPELMGRSEAEARALLADQGLDIERRDETRYDEVVAVGHVASQDPASGSLVKRGGAVEVVVSAGPRRVVVPALLGQALPAAQLTLLSTGLAVGRSAGVFRDGAAIGTIVEQDPPAGALAGGETVVHLLYALEGGADTFVMPDLVYRQYDDVRQFFLGNGFRLGSVKFELYEGVASGIVLRQYPLAGHPLRRRDAIALVVSTSIGMESGG